MSGSRSLLFELYEQSGAVFPWRSDHRHHMTHKSLPEIRALVAANNLAWLESELVSETDQTRHEVLARLLAIERRRLAAAAERLL